MIAFMDEDEGRASIHQEEERFLVFLSLSSLLLVSLFFLDDAGKPKCIL